MLAGILSVGHPSAVLAEDGRGSLPMVYDPQTKKYFIGGESKFVLKQSEGSGLIDRIEVSLDGGEYVPYEGAVRFSSEGKHTIKFRAVSPVNNWAPVQFMEVFVDLTPPVTQLNFSKLRYFKDDRTTYAALNSTIELQAQDNLSGVANIEYSWDGTNYSLYENPIGIEKKGVNVIWIRSRDRVGNVETPQRHEFVADGTPPASKLTIQGTVRPHSSNGRSFLAASDSVAFVIDAQDTPEAGARPEDGDKNLVGASKVKSIWISIDNKPYSAYLKPIYFLEEGEHTLTYYAEDNVGNKEEPKSLNIFTVSQPPRTIAATEGKIVNTGGINFATLDFRLVLSARENAVGLDRIEVKVDDEPNFRSYVEPIRFLQPGQHKVVYRAVDRIGNAEPTRTYSVIIQTTPPETTLETAQPVVKRDGVTYSPSPNVITFNVKNTVVGVERTLYSINDSPFQDYTGPITITSSQKLYKIVYKSIDKLGNEEKNKTVSFHMIGVAPSVDLFVSDGGSSEERVRTNYFEQSPQPSQIGGGANDRAITSDPRPAPQAPAPAQPAAAPRKPAPKKAPPRRQPNP